MKFWLARMAIPVQYTQLQGWQVYWQQTLTENMNFDKNIGSFIIHKNSHFKNERNRSIGLNPNRRCKVKRVIEKKEEKETKFAKGVSVIQ